MTTQPLTLQQHAQLNELKELEASGVQLPMPAEQILWIESQGHLVDLTTGEIIQGGATERIAITEAGKEALTNYNRSNTA